MDDLKKLKLRDLFGPFDDELEFYLSNFFGTSYPAMYRKEICWKPPIDVFETEDEYVITLELGQIKTDEISITYQKGVLYIRGVRQAMPSNEKRHYHKMEINYGPFERKVIIPDEIVMEKLKAAYEDGFLEIKLPKKVFESRNDFNIEID